MIHQLQLLPENVATELSLSHHRLPFDGDFSIPYSFTTMNFMGP